MTPPATRRDRRRIRLSWGAFYLFLFVYRCAFSVLGQTVVLALTSIPDTDSYQRISVSGALLDFEGFSVGFSMQQQATVLTRLAGGVFAAAVGRNPILINIGFQTLAFLGIVYFLSGLEPKTRRLAAVLFMFPSFSVWSSIASKEAIVVFLVCIVARYIVDIYRRRDRLRWWHPFGIGLLWMFKPHFIPVVMYLIAVPKAAAPFKEKTAVAVIAGLCALALLWAFRDTIDAYVLAQVSGIYDEPGNSSRDFRLLASRYDFFVRAPEGFLLALVGPTLAEASSGHVLQFAAFVESLAFIAVVVVWVTPRLPRMPVYLAVVSAFGFFWTMLANYPLGIANAGTAVRYRTDYMVLLVLVTVVLTSREVYTTWRRSPAAARSRRRPRGAVVGAHVASLS